jgi:hypothetical protein
MSSRLAEKAKNRVHTADACLGRICVLALDILGKPF